MTKLSKTYLGFRPGSRPAGPAVGERRRRPPGRRFVGSAAAAVPGRPRAGPAGGRRGRRAGRRRDRAVARSRPSRGRPRVASAGRSAPGRRCSSPRARRGRPVAGVGAPSTGRSSRDLGVGPAGGASRGVAGPRAAVPDGVGPDAERRCARRRRGPGLARSSSARCASGLGRPRTAGAAPRRGRRPAGPAGASSSWTATRMSRPNCSDSASASTRRIRDSSTVWVNSLGAASTAVSSTSPSGRVRFSIAFCCGDRLVASRSRIWSQTVARSSVASAMPFVLPMHVDPGRSRSVPAPGRPRARASTVTVPRCGRADALVPHRCPQAVHGRRRSRCRAPHRSGPPTGISAGRRPVRAGDRAVRRSVDRRGRPTRRDPVVRRGATATLTAPSTARQRSGTPPGRVGVRRRRRVRAAPDAAGWTMGGRRSARPPVAARSSVMLAGVCGRFRPSPARAVCAVGSGHGRPASGVAGVRHVAVRPGRPARARPPAGAHRRCRVVGVPREQAHVPAEQPPPVQDPRLPAADAHPRGPGDPRRSSAQGSREALRLTCCPRRHACAGVRSSPRSSGPADAPGDRPWCSTTSPNGPRRRPAVRRPMPDAAAGRCAGRFRGRQGRRQLGGPPPGDPAAARRGPGGAAPAARRRPTWWSGPGPRRPTAASAVLRRDLASGLDRLLGDRVAVRRDGPRPRAAAVGRCWPPSASTRGRSARPCRRGAASTRPAAPTPPRRSSGTAPRAAPGWRCAGWSSARPGTPAASTSSPAHPAPPRNR